MKTPSFVKHLFVPPPDSRRQAQYRARQKARAEQITITGRQVVIKGKASNAKTLAIVSRVFNIVELVQNILGHLEFADLDRASYVCRGFHDMAYGTLHLRKKLFREPDPDSEGKLLQLKIFQHQRWPSEGLRPYQGCTAEGMLDMAYHEYTHMFDVTSRQLERLAAEPKLRLLDRLLTQPPCTTLRFWIKYTYSDGRRVHQLAGVGNKQGITLRDFVVLFEDSEWRNYYGVPHWKMRGELIQCTPLHRRTERSLRQIGSAH